MKKYTYLLLAGLVAVTLPSLTGCGGGPSLGQVSGTITMDGEPMADIQVTFEPKQVEGGTAIVGPFSTGLTDSSGKYTLKTRNGDDGAVVGEHTVSVSYAGSDPQELLDEAKDNLRQAQVGEGDKEKIAEYKAEIEKLNNFKKVPERYAGLESELSATVASGDNSFDFALTTTNEGE